MRKNVLELDSAEARDYFLNEKSYSTIDLPPYISFSGVLDSLKDQLLDIAGLNAAKDIEAVNHKIYGNKHGKYTWRKYELINPLLYVSLVNVLAGNWNELKSRFGELDCGNSIRCLSIPVLPDENQTQKASQISEWINEVEKESVRLALDFEYLYQTDITDCYGSIYTHSLSWAIHGKAEAKAHRRPGDLFGNMIDQHLQSMAHGQTNGIPEGSVVMDFIAEILLAYADKELHEKIESLVEDEYCILRYRDDYRIFVRKPSDGDQIMKSLSEVLITLGLRLNATKTKQSDEIVINSIKPDKVQMLHEPNLGKVTKNELRRELLIIYELGIDYPNSGSVNARLSKLYEKVSSNHFLFLGQEKELLSILTSIAFSSPRSFHIVAAFVSIILKGMDKNNCQEAIEKVLRKINLLPNSGLLEIWLQRITVPNSVHANFSELLCQKVQGENVDLFDTSWIDDKVLKGVIDGAEYVVQRELETIDPVVTNKEIQLFRLEYPY